MSKPTIHVTNWASRKLHGPGRKYTIMARPRHWEWGDGHVSDLTPLPNQLTELREGFLSWNAYKAECLEKFSTMPIEPGQLHAYKNHSSAVFADSWPVEDGDTLCCSCSREAAANDKCHRRWAAMELSRAGWRVILDGKELK